MNDIKLTPGAKDFLQKNLAQTPDALGIRLGLRDYGCTGSTYTVEPATEMQQDDHVFDFDAIKIFIAPQFFSALRGTEIDLVQQGINSVLQFNNPNVINQCGCGESFKFKEEN